MKWLKRLDDWFIRRCIQSATGYKARELIQDYQAALARFNAESDNYRRIIDLQKSQINEKDRQIKSLLDTIGAHVSKGEMPRELHLQAWVGVLGDTVTGQLNGRKSAKRISPVFKCAMSDVYAAAEIAAKSGKSLQDALETLWRKKLNQGGISVIGKPPELPWRELIDEFWADNYLAHKRIRELEHER